MVTATFVVSHQWHKKMFGTGHASYTNSHCNTMWSSLNFFSLWEEDNFESDTVVHFHAFLYYMLLVRNFYKSSNEDCGLLHKSLATSPHWTACNQLTINTPFHSLRIECALPYFVLGGRTRRQHWPARTGGTTWVQHKSATSRLRATAQVRCTCKCQFSLAVMIPLSSSHSSHSSLLSLHPLHFLYWNQNRHPHPTPSSELLGHKIIKKKI